MSDNKKRESPRAYWCFTLNNYDENECEILYNVLKYECDWFIFQEEIGESGTPHLQGTLKLKGKDRKRLLQMKGINERAHWEPTKSVKSSIVYCTKQKSRAGNQYVYGIDIPEEIRVSEPYGWQLEVMDIVMDEPDERSIYWFFEPNGNVGKSSLIKYLVVRHNGIVVNGKGSDIMHSISKRANKRLIICDIPRVSLDYVNYSAIENVKNGLIFSGKYDSDQYVFNCPHVLCFANELPIIENFSIDRWKIFLIDAENQKLVPMVLDGTGSGNTELTPEIYQNSKLLEEF